MVECLAMRYRTVQSWVVIVVVLTIVQPLSLFAAAPDSWKADWEQTLAAAKKEGEISFYGSQGYEKVFEVFQKRYPDIKVNAVTNMRGSEHGARVMTERRAGKYLVDLFIDGVVTPIQVYLKANILEPIRPALILPEVTDESKWWEGKHHYADPDGKYIFIFQGNVHGGENAYNTKSVNPKEIKSYWDFVLEPGQCKEGAFVGPSQGGVNLFKNAPHPNAAKIAINWLLSREGQDAYQRMFAQQHDVRQSMREDISTDVIPPTYRRMKGTKYIYSGRPEWLDMGPVTKIIKEAQQKSASKQE